MINLKLQLFDKQDAFTQYHSFVYLQVNVHIQGQFMDRFVYGVIENEIEPFVAIKIGNEKLDNRFCKLLLLRH